MILISHRGNTSDIITSKENTTSYIDQTINLGYHVEIDVRFIDNKIFLGHDTPDEEISLDWLLSRKNVLWIHTKNFAALSYLIDFDLKVFYHQKENHTIINNCNIIWSHELKETNEKSIIPLLSKNDIEKYDGKKVFGICSDFVSFFRI